MPVDFVANPSFRGSNLYSVLLSSAIRIAQSLNIHRIGPDQAQPLSEDLVREREVQKSTWTYLRTQDWFSIPFTNAHAIAPGHCTTPLPTNCNGISGLSRDGNEFKSLPMESATEQSYMLNIFQGMIFEDMHYQRLTSKQWQTYAATSLTRLPR